MEILSTIEAASSTGITTIEFLLQSGVPKFCSNRVTLAYQGMFKEVLISNFDHVTEEAHGTIGYTNLQRPCCIQNSKFYSNPDRALSIASRNGSTSPPLFLRDIVGLEVFEHPRALLQ